MIELAPERLAAEATAEIVRSGGPGRAGRAVIDSREAGPHDLFFGLAGASADGGQFAAEALANGAWGVVVEPARAQAVAVESVDGWVLASEDPLRSLQALARGWRRELGCPVVGITGSTGKTSVKDIARALLPFRTHASRENFNTEIGLPLAILEAPPETECMILEMAMRGLGQIAELCEIAEPDVATITNVGPVHIELLGTLEAIVAAKAEILSGLKADGKAVIPADAEALRPHLRQELATVTFGPGGDVFARAEKRNGAQTKAEIVTPQARVSFEFPFAEAHNVLNATCAVAIGVALEASVAEMARRTAGISFSRLRGELHELPGGSVLVNDCYNANPISMRAALDHLASLQTPAGGRRIAVLGGMAELGPEGPAYHREAAAHARALGIDAIVGVGELARAYAPDDWVADPEAAVEVVRALAAEGDTLLVKGSRSIGLEAFTTEYLRAVRAVS